MGKNICFTVILVLLIVADVTAAFSWNVRKLTAPSPKEDPNAKVSPIPSPASGEKRSSPVVGGDKAKEKQNQLPSPASPSGEDKSKEVKSKDKQVDKSTGLPPPANTKEVNKSPEKIEAKGESKSDLPAGGNERCDGVEMRCKDNKSMVACIKSSNVASKALVLIQNGGDSSLKVVLSIPVSGNKKSAIDIPKHQNKEVDISLASGGINEITLNAGYGDCVLHLGVPASQGNYFHWLPSYSKFMTPMYGAYFLLLATVIAGGVSACCWFRKRKRRGDIPYQELEMSMPETAVTAETAEGWDQGWDDDWDEEKAVRSPGGRNISANGLSSRTPNKDGWEDWDD